MKNMKPRLPRDLKGKGFDGDFSGTPRFITDGNALILRSALLDDWYVNKDEIKELIKPESMQGLWQTATRSPSRTAYFVGCIATKERVPLAIISDDLTFIAFDPWRLSYVIQATAADGFEVNKHEPLSQPVVLMKDANPVAIVAPMRVKDWEEIYDAYHLVHDRVSISDALSEAVNAKNVG